MAPTGNAKRPTNAFSGDTPLPQARTSSLWKPGAAVLGTLGSEAAVGLTDHTLGAMLAIIDVIAPVITALILLIAILCGNDKTCERVFRLLRWLANRPEPAFPYQSSGFNAGARTGGPV